MHFSPSKYHSCSSQTVGFGVGQVGEVPHDGMSVGDGVTDSVVEDGSGDGRGVIGVGTTGSAVGCSELFASLDVGSLVVCSGTGVGENVEGLGVSLHTSQYIHSPSSNPAYSQHSRRVSKCVVSSTLLGISG